jgi:CheY-like chemotaxis protein
MLGQQNMMAQSLSPTILVVDDEPSITKLCKTILQQAGFSVLDADGSSAALKICMQHEPIDLLLTDLSFPLKAFNVHGHELAVSALHIRKDVRAIIMSGNIEQDLTG